MWKIDQGNKNEYKKKVQKIYIYKYIKPENSIKMSEKTCFGAPVKLTRYTDIRIYVCI